MKKDGAFTMANNIKNKKTTKMSYKRNGKGNRLLIMTLILALLAGVLVALLNGSDGATALRQGIHCAAATVAGAGPDAPAMSLYRQLSATDPVPVRL